MSHTDDFVPPEGFMALDGMRSRRKRRKAKPVAFDRLPKSARRNRAVSMGWRIRQDRNGAGVFLTHDILPGSGEWPVSEGGQVHWADVYFLPAAGARTGRIFNATFHTLAMRLAEQIESLAEDAVDAQLSDADRELSRVRMFLRRLPGETSSEAIFSPHRLLDSLGGLTVEGARAKWLRAHWDQIDTLVPALETAEILPDYAYGTGLSLITAQPNLTVEAVVAAINDFRARGEGEYAIPVDFATQRPLVEAMLRGKLWRWDCMQARAEGKEAPERPIEEGDVLTGYESNAIRI